MGRQADIRNILYRVEGKTARLIFPKHYLPAASFDWWMNAWTRPRNPTGASNPMTARATFTAAP